MKGRVPAEKQAAAKDRVSVLSLTVLAIYVYVFSEWLFFATKPSFMSSMGVWDRLEILIVTPLAPALIAAGLVILLGLPGFVIRSRSFKNFLTGIVGVIPSIVIALTLFLLIDNFTYTLFGFGVGTASLDQSWIYFVRAILLLFLSWIWVDRRLIRVRHSRARARNLTCILLIAASFLATAWRYAPKQTRLSGHQKTHILEKPDILLLGSDGLNASHLSLYGYERDTTPFLRELAQNALVCENGFSNSAHTGASIASMLTGRLPTGTRLVYPPDILRGADVYRHLPAVLKSLGYRTADISIRYYADAPDMNMREGFDYANSRRFEREFVILKDEAIRVLGQEVAYFTDLMVQRVQDRFNHLRGLSRMGDAFAQVAGTESKMARTDAERIKELFSFVDESSDPYFAHVHLMGTHEPFRPGRRVFSDADSEPHSMDAYDDTIVEFDDRIRQIVESLSGRGRFDKTLLIIHSDHGLSFQTDVRLPLLFLFPGGTHHGRVGTNTQNVDIAPTILDYLGVNISEWMDGQSLLGAPPPADRPIFSASRPPGTAFARGPFWQLDQDRLAPPYYSLGVITMIVCNSWFRLDLGEASLSSGLVDGHTRPCSEKPSPGREEARDMIIRLLEANDYETASLADVD